MRAIAVAATVCLTLAASAVARADEPALRGVFVNPTQPEAPIDAAIDAAVSRFTFAARPMVRSRLKKVNVALHRVEFVRNGAEITITLGTNTPSTTAPGRPPVKWTRNDGEIVDASIEWQGPVLVQTVTAGESKRVNRFELSPDGQVLTMKVTVTGPQLQTPVEYHLSFRADGRR